MSQRYSDTAADTAAANLEAKNAMKKVPFYVSGQTPAEKAAYEAAQERIAAEKAAAPATGKGRKSRKSKRRSTKKRRSTRRRRSA